MDDEWNFLCSKIKKSKDKKRHCPEFFNNFTFSKIIKKSTKKHEKSFFDFDLPSQKREYMDIGDDALISYKIAKRIKNGKIDPCEKLDLHGYTLDEAKTYLYDKLVNFYDQNKKLVLLVTGNGDIGKPTIKSNIGNWLNDYFIRRIILYVSIAPIKFGGQGAYLILLKRKK